MRNRAFILILTIGILGALNAKLSPLLADQKAIGPFSTKEIQALFVGHRFEWWSNRGRGTSQYFEGGSSVFTVNGETREGRWRIDGIRFCTYWGAFSNGHEKCHLIYQVDDETFEKRAEDGSVTSSFKRADIPFHRSPN